MTVPRVDGTLPGTALPPGTYTVESWAQLLLRDLFELPQTSGGDAHPLFAYVGTQVGIGIGVEELMALVGSTAEDGVMMASSDIDLLLPLRIGTAYDVTGEIVSLEHKEGRRTGPFDLMTYRLTLTEAERGLRAATVTNAWIVPRRSPDAV